jgi:hypothetical protein
VPLGLFAGVALCRFALGLLAGVASGPLRRLGASGLGAGCAGFGVRCVVDPHAAAGCVGHRRSRCR